MCFTVKVYGLRFDVNRKPHVNRKPNVNRAKFWRKPSLVYVRFTVYVET